MNSTVKTSQPPSKFAKAAVKGSKPPDPVNGTVKASEPHPSAKLAMCVCVLFCTRTPY